MRYKEFEKLVLQHLDQYSVSGIVIPPEYNNHLDQTQRICALANIALRTIATQSAPLSAMIALKDDAIKKEVLPNGVTIVTMPADFWKLTGKGFPNFETDGYARESHFQEVSPNQIAVPTREINRTVLTYYRYPRKLHGDEDELLDGSDMVADCASYYVAAQLARHENAYAYQSLYNEYETMMARLKKPMITEYLIDYLERVPDTIIPRRQELIQKLKAAQAQQNSGVPAGAALPSEGQGQGSNGEVHSILQQMNPDRLKKGRKPTDAPLTADDKH